MVEENEKRHPEFSLKSPEATSTVRHNAMSRDRLVRYFKALGINCFIAKLP